MEPLLTLEDITKKIHRSRSWIHEQSALGRFPPPIKLGRRSVWRSGDIEGWLDRQTRTIARDGVEVRP